MRTFRWVLALAMVAASARAQAPKRVVVLYFDNNTGNRDYDVLQKGLADMMVTDLSAVEALQVVEREKLQSLLDELKLQKSKYFDPATAQRIGKVAGAEYAVTGSFVALEPKLRIDIRLIEVGTARVALADKVVGEKAAFFDLQQELVDRFVHGLDVKLRASARAKSGATDVDTLLKYSRGLDTADKGDLKSASDALAEVVKSAPDFKLAQERYALLLKRLEEAGRKRSSLLSAVEEDLLKGCAEVTARPITELLPPGPPSESENEFWKRYSKSRDAVQRYLSCRAIQANLYHSKLKERMPQGGNSPMMNYVMSPAERVANKPLMVAYANGLFQAIADVQTLHAREPHLRFGDRLHAIPSPIEEEKLKKLNDDSAGRLLAESLPQLQVTLARFILAGQNYMFGSAYGRMRPSLVELDKSYAKQGFGLLEAALKSVQEVPEAKRAKAQVEVLDSYGECLIELGRKEEAVSRWQAVLDNYPTSSKYKDVEKKIQEVLCASPDCKAFEGMVRSCAKGLMMKGPTEMRRIGRVEGGAGLRRLADALAKSCPPSDTPGVAYNITYVVELQAIAMEALNLGDCKLYEDALAIIRAKAGNTYDAVFTMWKACQ